MGGEGRGGGGGGGEGRLLAKAGGGSGSCGRRRPSAPPRARALFFVESERPGTVCSQVGPTRVAPASREPLHALNGLATSAHSPAGATLYWS